MWPNTQVLLFFIILAALAVGWWLGRRGTIARAPSSVPAFRVEYFKGLNYLLNEQPDKAIEVFVRMLEADSSTVETHFALASLFRRRGEVDRAIRIHQNLIARPNLRREDRFQALFELAEDYMRAGLFDRAESLFAELVDIRPHMERALRGLLTIYEQQKDWEQAISIARKLESASGRSQRDVIAQYHCELAQLALEDDDLKHARKMLKRAQLFDRDSIRAALMLAELAAREGENRAAIRQYQRIMEVDADFVPEVLSPMARALVREGAGAELGGFLQTLCSKIPAARVKIALAALSDPGIDDPVAEACIRDYLNETPLLAGLFELVRDLPAAAGSDRDNRVAAVRVALRRFLELGPHYRCRQCGFTGKTLYWQCPTCRSWDSTRPRPELALSTAVESGQEGNLGR